MKTLAALLLLAASLSAAAFPHVQYNGWSAPRTVVAGHTTILSTTPQYAFNFTVNSSTNIYTVTGGTYTPVNGDLVNAAETTGTLPTGLYGMTDFQWPIWDVCNVSGATFQLKQDSGNFSPGSGPCTGTLQTVSDNGTGTHTLSIWRASAIYLDADPTGWPTGTTFTYKDSCLNASPTSGGKPYAPAGQVEGNICILAAVPSNATPGLYTTHTTFCETNASGNCTTHDWVIDVIAPPAIAFTPPSSFPSLTGKTYWEGVMVALPTGCQGDATNGYAGITCGSGGGAASTLSGPANYCHANMAQQYLGAMTAASVSMYLWNLVLDNMAIYTGNTFFRTFCFKLGMGHPNPSTTLTAAITSTTATSFTVAELSDFTDPGTGSTTTVTQIGAEYIWCNAVSASSGPGTVSGCLRGYQGTTAATHSNGAAVIGSQTSVKGYVTAVGGNGSTFIHWTEPLYRACRVFSDTSFCTAGDLMQHNAYLEGSSPMRFDLLRETSLALLDAVALSKYGHITAPTWGTLRDGLYSMVLRATESTASGVRVGQQKFILGIAAHALAADWQVTGDNRWPLVAKRIADLTWSDYDQGTHAYMNLEGPNNSLWGSNSPLWFQSAVTGNVGVNALSYQSLQSMLLEPFWFYYAFTGNTTYRDEGDDLFAHIFDQGGLTGKQASEVFAFTPNAVGWRTGTLSPYAWFGDANAVPSRIFGGTRISSSIPR